MTQPQTRRRERTEFENFARGAALATDRYGNYLNANVDFAFRAWCTRAEQTTANQARWINTDDYLPEPYRPVLVCSTAGGILAACRTDKGWQSLMIAESTIAPREITYWQPWPEPPQGPQAPQESKVKW